MEAVQRFGCGRNRGEKSEGDFRANEVIVDRLRNADDVDPGFRHWSGARHGAVTADDDDRVESLARERGEAFLGAIFPDRFARGGASRAVTSRVALVVRAENRAAARQNAGDILDAEWSNAMFDEALKTVLNADNLNPILQDRGLRNGADDCVEAGAIAAASEDAESARGGRHIGERGEGVRKRVDQDGTILATGARRAVGKSNGKRPKFACAR